MSLPGQLGPHHDSKTVTVTGLRWTNTRTPRFLLLSARAQPTSVLKVKASDTVDPRRLSEADLQPASTPHAGRLGFGPEPEKTAKQGSDSRDPGGSGSSQLVTHKAPIVPALLLDPVPPWTRMVFNGQKIF